ncbi:MAG: hypothetical protein ACFFD9_05860 [Candidatus Thorarchaeota archaeon]
MSKILSQEVRLSVLAELTPTENEIEMQAAVIGKLSEALENHAASSDFPYSFIAAQGSTGKKQTQLRGASDLDLFVALRKKDFEEILGLEDRERTQAIDQLMEDMVDEWFIPALDSIGAKSLQKAFSQHPYLSLVMADFDVDIVSCFDLTFSELAEHGPITAMDRTIHHTEYVANHLSSNLREDVRILKSFARASHSYGDTCAVGRMGFTGYAIELLVILKGGFDNALEGLLRLDLAPVDPLDRSLTTLRQVPAFKDDHIFIIDPTDTGRNVASSFDARAYRLLKTLGQQVVDSSHKGQTSQVMNLLLEKPLPKTPLPLWFTKQALVHEFESDGEVHYTVLRDKLHSLSKRIVNELMREPTGEDRFGKALSEVYFEGTRFAIGFLVEKTAISDTHERKGPPIDLQTAADSFTEAHPNAFERDGHLWVLERRKWTKAKSLVDSLVEENPIEGLSRVALSDTSVRLQYVMQKYVLAVENEFPISSVQG